MIVWLIALLLIILISGGHRWFTTENSFLCRLWSPTPSDMVSPTSPSNNIEYKVRVSNNSNDADV